MFSQTTEEKKLDWMYKGATSTVDREEYLLGRTIDKTLEELNAKEKQSVNPLNQPKNHVEHECIPPSIRDFKKLQLGEQVDLAQKLQEDPLIAIKKREEETRQKLLQNPVQLKKIQKILKSRNREEKQNQSYDSNDLTTTLLQKYMKVKHKLGNSNISAEDNLDRLIAKKILSLIKKFATVDFDTILNMFSDIDDDDTDDDRKTKKRKRKHSEKMDSETDKKRKSNNNNVNRYTNRYDTDSNTDHDQRNKKNRNNNIRDKKQYSDKFSHQRGQKQSRESNESENGDDSNNEANKRRKNNYGLIRSDGSKIHRSRYRNKSEEKSSETKPDKVINESKTPHKYVRKTLSEEEIEIRRKEMLRNAEWRDTERVRNVRKYRAEEQEELKSQNYNTEFIQKELMKSANSSTVESRIKANINNIQRSGRDMNTHFSRR